MSYQLLWWFGIWCGSNRGTAFASGDGADEGADEGRAVDRDAGYGERIREDAWELQREQ